MNYKNIFDLNVQQYVETLNPQDLLSSGYTKNQEYFKYIKESNLEYLEGTEIPPKLIRNKKGDEFKFKNLNNRLFITNGVILIPCSSPVIDNDTISVTVFYLPSDEEEINNLEIEFLLSTKSFQNSNFKIKLDSGIFYRHVISFLSDSQIIELVSVLTQISNEDLDLIRTHLSNGIQDVKRRIKLFFRLNLLGFFSILHLMKIGFIGFDKKKILQTFFIELDSYNTLSQSSIEIFGLDEILKWYESYFDNLDQVLKLFEYHNLINNEIYFEVRKNNSLQPIKRLEYHEYFSELTEKKEYEYKNKYKPYKHNKYYNSLNVIKSHGEKVKDNLREIENELRLKNGFNVVGSLISESILFEKISHYFTGIKVLSQNSPKWLGKQHLDIYLPDYNIGIEYQGIQHFESVSFFGGDEGLKLTKLRDKRKKRLCQDNGCHLIEVLPDYDINEVINEIEGIIEQESS